MAREVVRTGPDGGLQSAVEDGMAVFVIKPTGYAVPLDDATQLPRFSYIHQPDGTAGPVSICSIRPGAGGTTAGFGRFWARQDKRAAAL